MKINYSHCFRPLLSTLLLALAAPNLAAAPLASARPASATTAVSGVVDPVSGHLSVSGTLRRSWVLLNGGYVQTNHLVTVSSVNLTVSGVARRYLLLRPTALTSNAPVLMMLHANSVSPEVMATLTEVADYAATQGFWAVLPAAVGGVWKDDPRTSNADDVNFLTTLIARLGTQGADLSRIYTAGYSNGGFMATRLACAASDRIAAFGIVAATTRYGVSNTCGTPTSRPKAWFLGSADTIVPILGALDLRSADSTLGYWNGLQGCLGVIASSLPNRVATDGTTVQLTRHTGCAGGVENRLYTVTGGGHAWPGGLTSIAGVTSQDIKATGLIWNFVSPYRR